MISSDPWEIKYWQIFDLGCSLGNRVGESNNGVLISTGLWEIEKEKSNGRFVI